MSFYQSSSTFRGHICGLYYNVESYGRLQKTYLPQVELQAHATILATTSRTVLNQSFVNPSQSKGIREVRYTFPLYDGVSVVGFTCHVGERTIVGEVKEKEKARAVFKEAVAKGQTAGLFEQLPEASDVFTTTVGNIPPGAKVIVKITYLGELKHDMEVDGIRFTIPTIICPRYGSYPGGLQPTSAPTASSSGISITVDVDMADGSFIQKIQSPTHPISMTMGTTSIAPNAEPTMTKASASLTLGTTELIKDFVVQVISKNTGVPVAVLENHPTIPHHHALMATLVPKFVLPAEKPELVFVCDRSGSMGGTRIKLAIQALKVFLKSLPVGVKFNICSFGSSHSFLWKKSSTYSQQTLDEAVLHAEQFAANFGGTEMLAPLKATIDQRYKDMPLDVILLTDGEIWNQQALFSYLNESVTESKAPIRIFTLGIGNGVSHALIEGVAKAGDGFSQTVGEAEKMDTKVVRMLKGALSPHVTDYTIEVKYANATLDEEEEDFEIIERVTDSLNVKLNFNNEAAKPAPVSLSRGTSRVATTNRQQKKPFSLFDMSIDQDKPDSPTNDDSGEQKYAHLPTIATPRMIQAPQNIPSLFAFNRITAYLLLGPDAPKATPKSVLLRGTSTYGPLELEIPIEILDQPSETIHQLAAKKAISELEQGRGWLSEAKDESGILLKTKFEGRFEDMVEREAVRLGVQFQVGGKWCSFVAVESNKRAIEETRKEAESWEWLEDETQAKQRGESTGFSSWVPSDASSSRPQMSRFFANSDDEEKDEDLDSDGISGAIRCLRHVTSDSEDEDSDSDSDVGANRYLRDTASDSEDDALMSAGISSARRVVEPASAPPQSASQFEHGPKHNDPLEDPNVKYLVTNDPKLNIPSKEMGTKKKMTRKNIKAMMLNKDPKMNVSSKGMEMSMKSSRKNTLPVGNAEQKATTTGMSASTTDANNTEKQAAAMQRLAMQQQQVQMMHDQRQKAISSTNTASGDSDKVNKFFGNVPVSSASSHQPSIFTSPNQPNKKKRDATATYSISAGSGPHVGGMASSFGSSPQLATMQAQRQAMQMQTQDHAQQAQQQAQQQQMQQYQQQTQQSGSALLSSAGAQGPVVSQDVLNRTMRGEHFTSPKEEYQMQRMLLEQQNNKRVCTAWQEPNNSASPQPLAVPASAPPSNATNAGALIGSNHAQAYKPFDEDALGAQARTNAEAPQAAFRQKVAQAHLEAQPQGYERPGVMVGAQAQMPAALSAHAQQLQDYQMGLMLLEQQNKNRKVMRAAEQFNAPAPPPPAYQTSFGSNMPRGAQTFGQRQPTADHDDTSMVRPDSSALHEVFDGGEPSFSLSAYGADEGALDNFDFDSFLHKPVDDSFGENFDFSHIQEFQAPEPMSPAYSPVSAGHSPASPGYTPMSPKFAPTSPGYAFGSASPSAPKFGSAAPPAAVVDKTLEVKPMTPEELTHHLISLQTFEGSWKLSDSLLQAIQVKKETLLDAASGVHPDVRIFVTAVVVAVFEKKLLEFEGSWELVVDKAKAWLSEQGIDDVENLVEKAVAFVKA
jgi:hypothetical protein